MQVNSSFLIWVAYLDVTKYLATHPTTTVASLALEIRQRIETLVNSSFKEEVWLIFLKENKVDG